LSPRSSGDSILLSLRMIIVVRSYSERKIRAWRAV
jgi:hypothetical protein